MSLKSVQPPYGLYRPSNVATARHGDEAARPQEGGTPATGTVNVSDAARLLASLPTGVPATPESVRQLTAALADDLRSAFRNRGQGTPRNIGFTVAGIGSELDVKGDRVEASTTVSLLQSDPGLARRIQDIAAISRFLVNAAAGGSAAQPWQPGTPGEPATEANTEPRWPALAARVDAQLQQVDAGDDFLPVGSTAAGANRAAGNATETNRAIATYAAVAGTAAPAAPVAVLFDGNRVEIRIDGQPWAPGSAERP